MGGIAFAVFAGIYYWFPLYTGRWYQQTLAKWHFWLTMVGTNVTFFPMILLGYAGMPRRYAGYEVTAGPLELFVNLHQLATFGVLVLTVGQLIFLWNIVTSWLEGPRVQSADPWDVEDHPEASREWDWFAADRLPAVTDGGEEESEST
jgi:cytochrome c oxidase subunit 1